jgi:hypothetical protein
LNPGVRDAINPDYTGKMLDSEKPGRDYLDSWLSHNISDWKLNAF